MTNFKKSGYKWAIFSVALLASGIYYFSLQSMPPMLSTVESVFNINDATAGLLMSIVVVPGLLLAVPSGLLIDKVGFRKIGLITLVAIAFGNLVTAVSTTFGVLLLGRLIMGFGSSFLTVGTTAIIPHWFQKKETGTVMGIFSITFPISTMFAFFAVPFLEQSLGWQSPFIIGAAVAVLCAILFVIVMKDWPLQTEKSILNMSELRLNLSNSEVRKIYMMWLFFNIASTGFLTWAPTLFITFKGLTLVYASMVSSAYSLSRMLFVPFYGWVSDRTGSRKPFIIAGLLIMSVTMCTLNYLEDIPLIVGVLFLGAAAGTLPALAMALIPQTLPLSQTGIGFGMMSLSFRIASIIGAPLIGLIIQTTQSLTLTLFGTSIFSVIALIFALSLKPKS